MNYFKHKGEIMVSEAQESSYRKRFPKGKDWVEPKPNPFGHCGLNPDSYHGMEIVAVSIEKYEELEEKCKKLEEKIEGLENQYYFNMRNKQMQIEVLKNQLREAKNE